MLFTILPERGGILILSSSPGKGFAVGNPPAHSPAIDTSEIHFQRRKAPPVDNRFTGGAFHYELWCAVIRALVARTAAAEAAASPTTSPAAKTTASTATKTSASILTRLSFVHSQAATVEFRAIELGDSGLTF
jgi:hypothetical protein